MTDPKVLERRRQALAKAREALAAKRARVVRSSESREEGACPSRRCRETLVSQILNGVMGAAIPMAQGPVGPLSSGRRGCRQFADHVLHPYGWKLPTDSTDHVPTQPLR